MLKQVREKTYNHPMPYCKNCHHEISRLDSDVCPYCGVKDPITDTYQTMDVTQNIAGLKSQNLYRCKSQKKAALLCMLFGNFGVKEFYLLEPKKGWIWLLITLLGVAGIGSALYFVLWKNPLSFVLPLLAFWLFHFVRGLLFLKKESPKDGNGEFLR